MPETKHFSAAAEQEVRSLLDAYPLAAGPLKEAALNDNMSVSFYDYYAGQPDPAGPACIIGRVELVYGVAGEPGAADRIRRSIPTQFAEFEEIDLRHPDAQAELVQIIEAWEAEHVDRILTGA